MRSRQVVRLVSIVIAFVTAAGACATDNTESAVAGPVRPTVPDASVISPPDTGGSIERTDAFIVEISAPQDAPSFEPDAFFAKDPPPKTCFDSSNLSVPVPGGTPDCPDDKNREGCACSEVGKQAACWPGYRRHRNRGVCHDGTTTCIQHGEFTKSWGPCVGYQLPTGDVGKEACLCFSAGKWNIKNTSPCLVSSGTAPTDDGNVGALSTLSSTGQCPASVVVPLVKPGETWSQNSLAVDCAGHFKLCYALKAGDFAKPNPTDCVVAKVCTEADYPIANQEQAFPDLPAWVTGSGADKTCAYQFTQSGGYGEMTVIGLSAECDEIDDGSGQEKVFNRLQYCPIICSRPSATPKPAICNNCRPDVSGTFN